MTWLVMIFVSVVAAVLQMQLPPLVFLGQAKFPFLLGVVIYYALNRDVDIMLVAALIAGFLQDALSPVMPLGYSSVCFCVIAWLVSHFRKLVMTESLASSSFFGGVAGVVVTLVLYIALAGKGYLMSSGWEALAKAIGTGALATVCSPVMFCVVEKLDGVVGNIVIKESLDGVE